MSKWIVDMPDNWNPKLCWNKEDCKVCQKIMQSDCPISKAKKAVELRGDIECYGINDGELKLYAVEED